MANSYETIVHIGKGGVVETLLKQVEDALTARELIKMRVLETSPESVRETADKIAELTGSDVVQVIGSKIVLYRENKKDKKIFLVK